MPKTVPFQRRFNYTKANWQAFSEELKSYAGNLEPTPTKYDKFIELVHKAARNNIPRDCRTSYIPNLTNESVRLFEEYEQLFNRDPFGDRTVKAGESLLSAISTQKQQTWQNLVESTDMRRSSWKAWNLICKLGNDRTANKQHSNVTANQVAHQLVLNGKTTHSIKVKSKINRCVPSSEPKSTRPFTEKS